jgi:hypothetical protein
MQRFRASRHSLTSAITATSKRSVAILDGGRGNTVNPLEQAQRFLDTFGAICNHFRPWRHRLSAGRYGQIMRERFEDSGRSHI